MDGNTEKEFQRSKKLRTATRSAFTRIFNSLKEEINQEDYSLEEAQGTLGVLESKLTDLKSLDSVIVDFLLQKDDSESELDDDIMSSDEYSKKFNYIKIVIENKLGLGKNKLNVTNYFETDSVLSRPVSENSNRRMKLPLIEFKKFSGDLKEWLPFWGQFQRIDEDNEIDDVDKFQYLLQATVPNSRARKIVESYPPIAENYVKAVKSLKSRFGREDLLIEVYVRELLRLVLHSLNSKAGLSSLYDNIESQIRSLETLGVTSDKFAAMLYPLVESCLPEDVLRAWQRNSSFEADADLKIRLESLMEFLRKEVDNEERIALAVSGFENGKPSASTSNVKLSSMQSTKQKRDLPTAFELVNHKPSRNRPMFKCVFCNSSGHETENCTDSKNLSVDDKVKVLTKAGCCFLCTKFGHIGKTCRVKLNCSICKGRHVTVMCRKDTSRPFTNCEQERVPSENILTNNVQNEVLLQTLVVQVRGKKSSRRIRALIDTGSQHSYILKATAQEMEYEAVSRRKLVHNLFGGSNTKAIEHSCYRARVSNIDNSYACNFEVLDQDVICNNVSPVRKGPWMSELLKLGVEISDTFEGPIELLIGADVAGRLLTDQRKVLECGLVAVGTHLGWTLMGKIPNGDNVQCSSVIAVTTSMFINNKRSIANLWELDAIGIEDPIQKLSKEEEELVLKEHFKNSVSIDDDGRYEVNMPWNEGHPPLPTNINIAKKRLESTVCKLKKSNSYEEYDSVLKNWEREKIIEEVPYYNNCFQEGHYLPHRPVYKENSTTRVRPVFDASAREYNQPSLNDCLSKGINFIELIPSLILGFRLNKIGVIADIKKAFLQIGLSESDRDFVRFLWFDDNGRMKIYRHRRVVFGVCCSPFLLGAVINHHLDKELEKDSSRYSTSVLKQLQHSFYVDNCIASVDSMEELNTFIKEASAVFSDARFMLRGWEYSDKDISPELPLTSVLGMLWDRRDDVIKINTSSVVSKDCDSSSVTKRKILSVAHKVFDILGVTCPTTLFPKILLQKIWESKLKWDEEVTPDMKSAFLRWCDELRHLNEIKIPRWFSGDVCKWSLHTFCDASQHAYAAVIFLRVELNGAVFLHFVEAKARVAPVKRHSIPRLELLAANIGARLTFAVRNNLDVVNLPTTFWSDSSTVISWIQREDCWTTFVWNRTQEIRKLSSKESWRYVPGSLNPADLASRGCSPKELVKSKWWEGPTWLKLPEEEWPELQFVCKEDDINKEKKKKCIVSSLLSTEKTDNSRYFAYFSKFEKTVRMVAWMFRFSNNCKSKVDKISGPLNLKEILKAELAVVKMVQEESFTDITDGKLKSLCPYLDENGIIRLRTKLVQREDSENFRAPAVLPSKHPVVQMLIYDQHVRNCHVGVQGLLSLLREKFWIVNGRKTIRSVLAKCTTCLKLKSKNFEAEAIYPPKERVRDAACFEVCGVDFAGPLFLKTGEKAYICLFTCAFYRAIHIELVSSLSTSEFLQAFRRFIARRGRPSVIYSDNGKNFVGTKNLLDGIDWNKIHEYSSVERFEWRFNPPTAAWWGGWWERIIGLTKQLLRKILGKASLTYEELNTILCDCEAVLNSRPLTYVSEEVEDLIPITPSTYLNDIKEAGTPDLDSLESNKKLLTRRHNHLQKLRENLRQRFRSEYLGLLMLKPKKKTRSVQKGEVVIIQNENKKRLHWPLAVIEELISGRDGNVRLVKLRTGSNTLVRPIQKIFPLEVQAMDSLC